MELHSAEDVFVTNITSSSAILTRKDGYAGVLKLTSSLIPAD